MLPANNRLQPLVGGAWPLRSVRALRSAGMTSYPAFSCPGHGQPCEVRTVTKAGSKHLGRPFYVCTASPQCTGWFQLADEPVKQAGKRVAVSIGTDVVVSATVCTDGGETQQKVLTTPTALPDANTDADANPAPNPANPDPDPSLNPPPAARTS